MLLPLMYHSISSAPPGGDFWGLIVSPDNFNSHLSVLKNNFEIANAASGSLVDFARSKDLRVLLTVDDGYADNLYQLVPLLELHEVPAVIMLASGFVGQRYFWWDALEALFRGSKAAKSTAWGDQLRTIWTSLLDMRPAERTLALEELRHLAGDPPLGSNRRPLTQAEVAELARCGLISFGGHTYLHSWLPHLSIEQMSKEIEEGKQKNEELTGKQQVAFAYPFGAADANAKRAAAEAGFAVAFTATASFREWDDDPLLHPRIAVGNWSEAEFLSNIQQYARLDLAQ